MVLLTPSTDVSRSSFSCQAGVPLTAASMPGSIGVEFLLQGADQAGEHGARSRPGFSLSRCVMVNPRLAAARAQQAHDAYQARDHTFAPVLLPMCPQRAVHARYLPKVLRAGVHGSCPLKQRCVGQGAGGWEGGAAKDWRIVRYAPRQPFSTGTQANKVGVS